METNNVGLHRIHVDCKEGRITAEQTWKSWNEMIKSLFSHLQVTLQLRRELDDNKCVMLKWAASFILCGHVDKYWKAVEIRLCLKLDIKPKKDPTCLLWTHIPRDSSLFSLIVPERKHWWRGWTLNSWRYLWFWSHCLECETVCRRA